jgi:hypothetical protein
MHDSQFSEVLFVGGERRQAVHETLERVTGWKIHWPDLRDHTRLSTLHPIFLRVQLIVIATKLTRKESRLFARLAKRRGVTVIKLPGGFSPAQIFYRLDQQRGQANA